MISLANLHTPRKVVDYFRPHFQPPDSAQSGGEPAGRWIGDGSTLLGLKGGVREGDLHRVLVNRHPFSGKRLCPRRSPSCCLDFCFSAPKSFSIMASVDSRLGPLVLASVEEHWPEIEADARVRDRRGRGVRADRTRGTGKLVAALLPHHSSRENDPQIHVHGLIANLSYDETRGEWLALDSLPLFRDQGYHNWMIQHRLAGKLAGCGYQITLTPDAFELRGVPAGLLTRFSQRRQQVEAKLQSYHEDASRLRAQAWRTPGEERRLACLQSLHPSALKRKAALATRRGKIDLTQDEMLQAVDSRLSGDEKRGLEQVFASACRRGYRRTAPPIPAATVKSALATALQHEFSTQWLVPGKKLLAAAIRQNFGMVPVPALRAELSRLNLGAEGSALISPEAAADLAEIAARIRSPSPRSSACLRVATNDRAEAPSPVVKQPRGRVTVLAPGRRQERHPYLVALAAALKNSPPGDALLLTPTPPQPGIHLPGVKIKSWDEEPAPAALIVVDRAELLTPHLLKRLLAGAKTPVTHILLLDGRLRRSRGALPTLLDYLAAHHQLPSVDWPSSGPPAEFAREQLGRASGQDRPAAPPAMPGLSALHFEKSPAGRHRLIAREYRTARECAHSALVITGTEAEASGVTQAIRADLHAHGLLKGPEASLLCLQPAGLTMEQRRLPQNYAPGQWVEFHQNAAGFRKGTRLKVHAVQEDAVLTAQDNTIQPLPLEASRHFRLYNETSLAIAQGEQVMVARHRGCGSSGRLVLNRPYAVRAIAPDGTLTLENDLQLRADHGHVIHGYARVAPLVAGPHSLADDLLLSCSARTLRNLGGWALLNECTRAARKSLTAFSDDPADFAQVLAETRPVPAPVTPRARANPRRPRIPQAPPQPSRPAVSRRSSDVNWPPPPAPLSDLAFE